MLFLRKILTPRDTEGNIEISENESHAIDSLEISDHELEVGRQELEDTQEAQDNEFSAAEHMAAGPSGVTGNNEEEPTRKKPRTVRGNLAKKIEQLEKTLPSRNTLKYPVTVTPSAKRMGTPKRDTFEEEMLKLEAKKIALLEKQNIDGDDEDLNFFKSLIPHVKQLPPLNKLYFRSQVQNMLMNELTRLQNNVSSNNFSNSTSLASTPMPSPVEQNPQYTAL
nr:unnamed protein product [Callosobruchus chinensis]